MLATGDAQVLQESAPFLEGRTLHPEEDSYYDLPSVSEERASLYEHCVRAIRNGLRKGVQGLPLMGSGDWNDGMNLVGFKGQGESIWLAFFLFDTLQKFSPLAQAFGDEAFANECLAEAERLRQAIDQHGWDGAWYRRLFRRRHTAGFGQQCKTTERCTRWSFRCLCGCRRRGRGRASARSCWAWAWPLIVSRRSAAEALYAVCTSAALQLV